MIRSGLVLLSLTLAVGLAWWLLALTTRPAAAEPAHGSPASGTNGDPDRNLNEAGTVPYHAMLHEFFDMKGIVIVTAPVGVTPSGVGPAVGFASEPWPNPTSRGTSFRFTLGEGGRVRADVVDARGRHVTTIVDAVDPSPVMDG